MECDALSGSTGTESGTRRVRADERGHAQCRRALLMTTLRMWQSLGEHERAACVTADNLVSEFLALPEKTREQLRRAVQAVPAKEPWKAGASTTARSG